MAAEYGAITSLLEQNSSEWTKLWKSAVLEITKTEGSTLPQLNSLFKIIDSLVKARQPEPIVQALGCWKYLIEHLHLIHKKEKCFSVLVYPLTNTTNLIPSVLEAKLEVWETLISKDYILNPGIVERSIEELMKFLHGAPKPAIWFSAERGGIIYKNVVTSILNKMSTTKNHGQLYKYCIRHMLSHLRIVIMSLNRNDKQRTIAREIWKIILDCTNKGIKTEMYITSILEKVQEKPTQDNEKLLFFMLDELIKNQRNIADHLVANNLKLISKCLPLLTFSDQLKILVDEVLMLAKGKVDEFVEHTIDALKQKDSRVAEKYWRIVMECCTDYYLHNAGNNLKKMRDLLLFPLHGLQLQWNEATIESWKECYVALTSNSTIIEDLISDMSKYLKSDAAIPTTSLTSICFMLKIILVPIKSDSAKGIKMILKKIYSKMSSPIIIRNFQYRNLLSYYSSTLEIFVKTFEEQKEEMTDCLKYVESQKKVIEMDFRAFDTTDSKTGQGNVTPNTKVGGKYSLLTRLSPGYKRNEENENCKFEDEKNEKKSDYVYIPAKSKTTPLTEHQMERKKSHIPALYQGLSQDSHDAFTPSEVVTRISTDEGSNRRQSIQFQEQGNENDSIIDSMIVEEEIITVEKNEVENTEKKNTRNRTSCGKRKHNSKSDSCLDESNSSSVGKSRKIEENSENK